jgi:hypothetical protein
MKKQLLFFIALSVSLFSSAQISVGFVNDFEDGTTQGWSNGGSSPNPPTNVTTGGPEGIDDNYLEEISAGGGGAGSKMVIFNSNLEWTGNYTESGTLGIGFDLRNPSNEDLKIRIAFEGAGDNTQIASSSSINLPAQSDWRIAFLSTDPEDFVVVNGGSSTIEEVLQDVNEIRILHNPIPDFNGASIDATLHIDNINTSLVLDVEENFSVTTSIFPTLTTKFIYIQSEFLITQFQVYDIQGRIVLSSNQANDQINVTSLSAGNYIIKLISEEGLVTAKKFIKQ